MATATETTKTYTDAELEQLLDQQQQAKDAKSLAEVRIANLNKEILAALAARGDKHTFTKDGKSYSAIKKQAKTLVIDEKGLRRSMGVRKFIELLTVPKFDKGKLDEAVKHGKVKKETVVKYSSFKPSAAYPSVTELKEKDETQSVIDAL